MEIGGITLPLPSVSGFEFIRLIGVNWSLAYEWRFYVMLPVIFAIVRNLSLLPVAVVVVLLAICDAMLSSTPNLFWAYFLSGAIAAPLFNEKIIGRKLKYLGNILIVTVILIYVLGWYRMPNYGSYRWVLMTVLFFALAMLRPYLMTIKPLVAMGSLSYSFYLLHVMVLFGVFYIFNMTAIKVSDLSFRYFVALACSGLIVAMLISAISYLKIERPFMRQNSQ